jgi:cytochrome c oxidase cbb3-type subunit I/II
MVRPFRSETARYGEYSKAGEFVYDHPFQWGSKRTGPDLAREGSLKLRKSNSWHFNHLYDPSTTSAGSVMPKYPWLFENDIDMDITEAKIKAMQTLGVPYEVGYEKIANDDLKKQAEEITADLQKEGIKAMPQKEIIAVIAYLQRLGTDISAEPKVSQK